MDDLQDVADRTSSVLHQLQVQVNQSPELASRDARAFALRQRSARRRSVAGTGIALAVVGVGIAVGVSFIGPSDGHQHMNTLDVRPVDQPTCPAGLPAQPSPGGDVLTADHATPALATLCVYDPRSGRLGQQNGTFRPVDIADFLSYVRSLPVSRCNATATFVAAASVEILFTDHSDASLVFRSTEGCVEISDGAATETVRVSSLTGQWRNVIDPALSYENPPPPSSGQPSGSLPPASGIATSGPPTSTASSSR